MDLSFGLSYGYARGSIGSVSILHASSDGFASSCDCRFNACGYRRYLPRGFDKQLPSPIASK